MATLLMLWLVGMAAACAHKKQREDRALGTVFRKKGEAYLAQGKLALALAEFRRAEKILPKDPDLAHDIGLVLLLRTEYANAETAFRRAIQLDSEHGDAHMHLGVTLVKLNRLSEALEALDTALDCPRFTNVDMALFNKGKALLALGREQEGIQMLERSAERNPGAVRAYRELGRVYLKRRQWSKAIDRLQIAVQVARRDCESWLLLGEAHLATDKKQDAADALEKARTFCPEGSDPWRRAGELLGLFGGS
jgi:tetratricopeptide (TPR) repeat protein